MNIKTVRKKPLKTLMIKLNEKKQRSQLHEDCLKVQLELFKNKINQVNTR
mgnify:CR=1 FL=1